MNAANTNTKLTDGKIISRDDLVKLQNSKEKFKLVDVLDSKYYEKAHIKGAISIPLLELREKAENLLQKDEMIVVYCGSFDCPMSTKAAAILTSLGYKNVLNYKGGLKDYKDAKLPLEGRLYSKTPSSPPSETSSQISAQTTQKPITFGKKVFLNGKEVTLMGRGIENKIGAPAPQFIAVDGNLEKVSLSDDRYKNKIKVLTSFLSLDTPVCDLQVKKFNQEAAELSSDVIVLGISKDLPFAQKRFCVDNHLENIITLSDYQTSSFGINYGLLIKENNLLARAVVILDGNNIIRYLQIDNELTSPLDYDDMLKNLAAIIKAPLLTQTETLPEHCVPCEGDTPPLAETEIEKFIVNVASWQLVEGKKLVKEFKFKDFIEAKYFLDLLAVIAEEQGHHPNFTLIYNKLKVTLTTHAAGGLTNNDFIMAKIIDEI